MRKCTEYEITVAKLLNVVHRSTERIKIHVVADDKESVHDHIEDFYLTTDFSGTKEETERVLKYYADAPVWNLHVDKENDCHRSKAGTNVMASIVAHCHYADIRNGYLREKEDARNTQKNPN